MTIAQAIKQMAASSAEIYCKICTVDAVDDKARTVDCTPLDDSAPLLGVNLQANQDGEEGVVIFPTVGCYVVVGFISSAMAVVLLTEQINKIALKIGETTAEITSQEMVVNGGKLGGMVKITELTQKLNELITAFNTHTHELQPGMISVAGSATMQANPAPVVVPPVAKQHDCVTTKDYEDEKVKH